MSNGESVEVKIARIDERVEGVRDELTLAREARKHQYEMLEKVNQTLIRLDGRVTGVEQTLTAVTPTIDEFVNIKVKVQGAGMAGKALWAVGATLISVAFACRESILAWLAK